MGNRVGVEPMSVAGFVTCTEETRNQPFNHARIQSCWEELFRGRENCLVGIENNLVDAGGRAQVERGFGAIGQHLT